MKLRVISLVLVFVVIGSTVWAQGTDCDLENAAAFAERAETHARAGDYALAIADYTCALELSPRNTDYYNQRGIAYDDLGDYDNALLDYEKALEIDPNYGYAYNNRGNIYYTRGDYEQAIIDYTRSLEVRNDEASIPYFNRGNAYYELGKYDRALDDLTRAIEAEPDYDRAYLSRAWTYLVLGDDRAHNDFATWIALIETDTEQLTLDGSLDGQVISLTEGKVYHFTFEAEAGDEISVEASARPDADIDPLLVLMGADGEALISDDDSGVNLNAVIPSFIIPADGTYELLLSHADGGKEGEVSLTVNIGEAVATIFASYKLFVNAMAEVYTVSGDTLNLREGPGLDFEIREKLERGTLVTLLEGPRKADNYAWWRVRTVDNVEGWAVERADEEQTLQLALLVGNEAIVTIREETLNLRAEPARGGDLVTQMADGTRVTLLEVPVIADGFRWWKLRTADGDEGWAIDRFQGERLLIPARERE